MNMLKFGGEIAVMTAGNIAVYLGIN